MGELNIQPFYNHVSPLTDSTHIDSQLPFVETILIMQGFFVY